MIWTLENREREQEMMPTTIQEVENERRKWRAKHFGLDKLLVTIL